MTAELFYAGETIYPSMQILAPVLRGRLIAVPYKGERKVFRVKEVVDDYSTNFKKQGGMEDQLTGDLHQRVILCDISEP